MNQTVRTTEASERSPQLIARLVDVWEASVRKTHLFLSPEQVEEIKAYVPRALAEVERLVVVETVVVATAENNVATSTEGEGETGVTAERENGGATTTTAESRTETATPTEANRILGFMGVQDHRLEMLFLAPNARGKGIGRQLLELGIRDYSVRELTVNEQNPQAVGFYQHLGFQTYKRTDHDEQGAPCCTCD